MKDYSVYRSPALLFPPFSEPDLPYFSDGYDELRYQSSPGGKTTLMKRTSWFLCLMLIGLAGSAGAGSINDRVQGHVESAVKNGVQPTDFHHLFFALNWRATFDDWQVAERALDRLSGASKTHPLMKDELRLMRSRLEMDGGRDAAARELFRTMGGLTRWWFLGPEPLEELQDFDGVGLPAAGDAGWREAAGTDPLGWLHISGLAWPPQRQMAYLGTTIVSDREQPVAIRVGVAQVARIWLNGSEIATTPKPLARAEDQMSSGAWLRAGRNSVVIAVASEDDRWWLRARLTQPDGSPLTGVREAGDAPIDRTAVDREAPPVQDLRSLIQSGVDEGVPGATVALAAYLVAHRPEPVGGGGTRSACRAARSASPAESRLLEWLVTTEARLARDLLAEAVEQDPQLVWARLELAEWLADRNLFEQAHAILEGFDSDEPSISIAKLDLDAMMWGPVMIPEMAALARAWPRCLVANMSLADGAMDGRRWDLAEEAIARLTEFAPGLGPVFDLRAEMAESCGDGTTLREIYGSRLRRDPNQPDVRLRMARLQAADNDLDGARTLLDDGLRRSPTDVDLLMELASIEHLAGDEARTTEIAREVLSIRPQNRRAQRLLELLGEGGEDFDWLRSPEELWAMVDAASPARTAQVIVDRREVEFLPSNLIEERVQQAIYITEADRANDLLSHHIPFVAEKERLRILRARILRRDGSEVGARQGDTPRLSEPEFNLFYDTRLRVLQFTEFEDGDLVEIAYVLSQTGEANDTGPYNGGLIPLGRALPVALMEVELSGPSELLPAWELIHIEGEPNEEVDSAGRRSLRWQWRDIEAVPNDVPAAPQLMVTPYMVYSNHPEWEDLTDWYLRHIEPRVRVSTQVEETANRLVVGIEDRLERIQRIYRFVTNEIKYVGLEFGEHRFRPFSADWVLHHEIGDCKDKAALLVALFDVIGIPAHMVMVRTSDLGPVGHEMALLETFNHAIVYLPEDDLWLDGTATGHPVFPPPDLDQDALVLVAGGELGRPQTTPTVGAGLAQHRFVLSAEQNGNVEIEIRARETGGAADRRRARFAGSRDPQRFARWLQEQFPGAQLTGEPTLQIISSRDPTIVEITGLIASSSLKSTGGIKIYPGDLGWAASMVPGGERSGPLMIVTRPDLEWSVEVDLGRPPLTLPDPIDLETRFGTLRVELASESSGYRVDGFFHFRPGLTAAEDVGELRDFLVEVERQLERRLESP